MRCKHGNLGPGLRTLVKLMSISIIPRHWEVRDKQCPKVHWLANPPRPASSDYWETLSHKTKCIVPEEWYQRWIGLLHTCSNGYQLTWLHFCAHTPPHIHTHTHEYPVNHGEHRHCGKSHTETQEGWHRDRDKEKENKRRGGRKEYKPLEKELLALPNITIFTVIYKHLSLYPHIGEVFIPPHQTLFATETQS